MIELTDATNVTCKTFCKSQQKSNPGRPDKRSLLTHCCLYHHHHHLHYYY